MKNESCCCVEYILKRPYVNSAGAIQDAVAVIHATGDKCMNHVSTCVAVRIVVRKFTFAISSPDEFLFT